MQPKTKEQKRIMELFATLKPLTPKQKEWGKYLYDTKCFFNSKGNICAYCGEFMGNTLTCPVCGKNHEMVAPNNRKRSISTSFNITSCVDQWQVIRTYEVYSVYRKGKPCHKAVEEVCQTWIDSKGKQTRISRGKGLFGQYFTWGSPMEIRKVYKGYYGSDTHEHYQTTYTYPYCKSIMPILKRNGLKSITQLNKAYASPTDYIYNILNNSKAETMVKQGYGHLIGRRGIFDQYWEQLKIAMRHKYNIADWTLWIDTLSLLRFFNMDRRNPVYICSQDLRGLHDRLLERKRRQQEREERERQARIAEEQALRDKQARENYIANKGIFFGLCIVDRDMTIEVLKSVEDFIAEGNAMHHCVNACRYYERENSLILSARINGERVETIEVDLNNFRIVQSRGVCNSQTEHHNRIINLVLDNMEQIRKIKQKANKTQKVA
jgi:hypothetical protein